MITSNRVSAKGGFSTVVAVAALAAVLATGMIVLGIHLSHRFFIELMGEQLSYIAEDIASRVDADAHASLRTPDDMDSPGYRKISEMLEQEQRFKKEIKSAYTLRIKDGKVRFIMMPPVDLNDDGRIEGELEQREPIGTPYGKDADPEMLGAAILGKTTPGVEITTDRWGTWLSGCAPLVTSALKVDGALCVDQDARPILKHMYKLDAVVAIGVVLVCLAAAVALVSHFSAKIEKTRRAAAERGRTLVLKLFETVFDNVPHVPLHILDRKGRISFWNRASEEEFGMSREEAAGKYAASFLADPAQVGEFMAWIEKAWQEKVSGGEREWRVRKKDGAVVKSRCRLVPVIYGEEVIEMMCIGVRKTPDA